METMNEIVDKYPDFVMILVFIIITIAIIPFVKLYAKDQVRKSLQATEDEENKKKPFRDFQAEKVQLEIKVQATLDEAYSLLRKNGLRIIGWTLAVCVLIFGLFGFNLEWIINSRILWSI